MALMSMQLHMVSEHYIHQIPINLGMMYVSAAHRHFVTNTLRNLTPQVKMLQSDLF